MLKKNNRGFTLLEVIISIAMLSLMSLFILQMFLASSNLNDRAKDTDVAINHAITEIENLKKHTSLLDYIQNDAFGNTAEYEGMITIWKYFDNEWNLMELSESIPNGAKYYLKININPDEAEPLQKGSITYGKLYTIQVDVTDISTGENGLTLTSLKTKKYFPKSYEKGI